MLHRLETMKQPNGSTVTIDIEQIDGYSGDELEKYGEKHRFYAEIAVDFGYGSFHCPRHNTKTLYSDKLGYYTYKKQKIPFYYHKSQNIKEDYDNCIKNKDSSYSIPLNEPRKLKKNIF